jgi:transposase
MARKRIPDKTREKVLKDYNRGKPKSRIADAYGISTTSVTRIIKEKEAEGVKTEAPAPAGQRQKLSDAERRAKELEMRIVYMDSRNRGKGTMT